MPEQPRDPFEGGLDEPAIGKEFSTEFGKKITLPKVALGAEFAFLRLVNTITPLLKDVVVKQAKGKKIETSFSAEDIFKYLPHIIEQAPEAVYDFLTSYLRKASPELKEMSKEARKEWIEDNITGVDVLSICVPFFASLKARYGAEGVVRKVGLNKYLSVK